jgi:hypothetical protein
VEKRIVLGADDRRYVNEEAVQSHDRSSGRNEGDAHSVNDKGLVIMDRKVCKDAYYWYPVLAGRLDLDRIGRTAAQRGGQRHLPVVVPRSRDREGDVAARRRQVDITVAGEAQRARFDRRAPADRREFRLATDAGDGAGIGRVSLTAWPAASVIDVLQYATVPWFTHVLLLSK